MVKIKDSIKASAKAKVGVLETNRNKPCFDEECSELTNKRKQIKLQTTKLQKSLTILGAIPVECSGK